MARLSDPEVRLRNMPAIAFTALGAPDDLNRISIAGYDAHVLKPADLEELARVIERLCHARPHDSAAPGGFVSSTPAI